MKSLRLISRIRSPYGGMYAWTDPMLPGSAEIKGTTWDMLLDRARLQRRVNGIPTGLEFDKELEREICKRYPAECDGWDPAVPKPRPMSTADVLRGTMVMGAHKIAGSPLEPQGVAFERARICASNECGQNINYQKSCHSCNGVEKLVQSVIGNSSTPYDNKLGVCSVCHCALKSAVWTKLEIQAHGVTDTMRQQFQAIAKSMSESGHTPCWKAQI